jgi:hypothetical protein
MTAEKEIQKDITAYLNTVPMLKWFIPLNVGGRPLKPHPSAKGMPDIIVCYKGRFIGLEVKNKTGTHKPAQKDFKADIERSSGIYEVVRSVDEVIKLIEGVGWVKEIGKYYLKGGCMIAE